MSDDKMLTEGKMADDAPQRIQDALKDVLAYDMDADIEKVLRAAPQAAQDSVKELATLRRRLDESERELKRLRRAQDECDALRKTLIDVQAQLIAVLMDRD